MSRVSFLKIALSLISVCLVLGCGPDATAPSDQGTISLLVVSGGSQSGVVGTELAQPLRIRATNSRSGGIANLTVNFRVMSGGGSMFAGVASTDGRGYADDYWTLGTSTGQPQRVEVRAVLSNGQKQVYGIFTATARSGPAAQITVQAGNGQTANVSSTVAIAPAVLVTDQYGNPVPSIAVTFVPTVGSGSLSGGTPTSNSLGIATVGSWTLGSPGTNTLIATVAGTGITGNPVTFTATGVGCHDCWTAKASIPTGRDVLGAAAIEPTLSVDGVVYAVGGAGASTGITNTVEAFDPNTNTWSTRASMPTARGWLGVAALNGLIYAVGGIGFDQTLNVNTTLATVEAYDPTTDAWTARASMPTPRYSLAVTVVNGKLYAVGGANSDGFLSTVEVYDPTTNSWTGRAPMPTARYHLGVAAVNGLLFAIGGNNGGRDDNGFGIMLTTVEVFDPNADSWTTRAPMLTGRSSLGVAALGGIIYAVGGGTGSGTVATVEAYDPGANTWAPKAPLPTPLGDMGVATLSGLLYVVGGNPGASTPAFVYEP